MTDPQSDQVTLEDVRTRFLETEEKLQEAVGVIEEIRTGAEGMVTTRESLVSTSDQLAVLSTSLADVAGSLVENADQLRQGVEALRLGDPAEVRRQMEELGEAFSASQAVAVERFEKLETDVQTASSEAQTATADAQSASSDAQSATIEALAKSRFETRIGFVLVAMIGVVAIVVSLVGTPA